MSQPSACAYGVEDERAARFVANTLPAADVEAFEVHVVQCAACQEAVRDAVLFRRALRTRRARSVPIALALAAAAVLVVVLARPDPVRRLGRIGDVPRFDGLPVRQVPDVPGSAADRGMDAYIDGSYGRAAELLGDAARADPEPGVWFFLGIARLVSGDSPGAIEALRSALRPEGNSYAREARLYLAKAHLGDGRADEALEVLAAVEPGGDPVTRHAMALADSIRAAQR